MNDLLNLAVEAHRGLKRWSRVEAVAVAASITGEIWRVKSKPVCLIKTFRAQENATTVAGVVLEFAQGMQPHAQVQVMAMGSRACRRLLCQRLQVGRSVIPNSLPVGWTPGPSVCSAHVSKASFEETPVEAQ